jgi:signal peptidase I
VIMRIWRRNKVVDWAITIVLAIVFVLVFEAEVAKPYRIPTSSMEPTLHCAKPGPWCQADYNDRILVNRLEYDFESPSRGQIVVFTAPPATARCELGDPGSTFVKRLIGLPGDTITERNGFVSVNGKPLADSYVEPALRDHTSGTWHVPAGRYFFMGDDRIHSCDSRVWGSVPRHDLIGPVLLTYWPPDRISLH